MSTAELKPCPFCGSCADMQNQFMREFWAQCTNLDDCGAADARIFPTPREAADAWNHRSSTTPAQAPAQAAEPVAWVDERAISWLSQRLGKASAGITTMLGAVKSFERPMPLYAAPHPSEPAATGREHELLCWAYSKLLYRSFDNMDDALAMDEIKLLLTGSAAPTGEAR